MKNIVLLNFDKKAKKRLVDVAKQVDPDFEVAEIQGPKELDCIEERALCVFYFYQGDSDLESDLTELRKARRNVPVNIIFKKKDFGSLVNAYDLPVTSVLGPKYTPGDFYKAMRKCELGRLRDGETELPSNALMNLLSSPIKIKGDRDLYRQLYTYFKSFPENIEFSFYLQDKGDFELIEGPEIDSKEPFSSMREFDLPKIFVGKMIETARPDGKVWACFPVYETGGAVTWCVCALSGERVGLVLNNIFFRYIENALVFRKNAERVESFQDLSNKDDVTGLFNQRKLVQDLADTIDEHEAKEDTFSVMFIDMDHFKKVNDSFGHLVGSQMLTEIGNELKAVLRSSDKIYRYGGDEFVVLMPKVDIKTVHKIAVRVRETVKGKTFNVGKAENYHLSLSIGIAEYPSDARTAGDIISFADSMMYVSKKSGRGKVFHVGEVIDDAASAE